MSLSSFAISLLAACAATAAPAPQRTTVLDLSAPAAAGFVLSALGVDPSVFPATKDAPRALELRLPATSDGWTELDFSFVEQYLRSDWSAYAAAELDVENLGDEPLVVGLRLRNVPASDAEGAMAAFSGQLAAGERGHLRLPLLALKLGVGFGRWPSQGAITDIESDGRVDPGHVVEVGVFFDTKSARRVRLRRVELADPLPGPAWIDRFGQAAARDWPGKIADEPALAAADKTEAKALAAAAPVPGRDAAGACADGPSFSAGKFFRLEREGQRWWLVAPGGRPFFATCLGGVTSDVAARWDAPRRAAYGWKPPRKGRFETAWLDAETLASEGDPRMWPSFYRANLVRKWGERLDERFEERAKARLSAWGFNCAGPWSDDRTVRAAGLPRFSEGPSPALKPSEALSPDFEAKAKAAVAPLAALKDDPNVIGHFLDEESNWDDVPADKLAEAADRYCGVLSRELRRVDPNHLVFGPRFAAAGNAEALAPAWRACAKHVDALAFDDFSHEPSTGPAGTPRLAAAYSFNSLDDGLLAAGVPVASRAERAVGLQRYLEACAADPDCVGASYYQYVDEPVTGRADGDFTLNGLVSVADVPYDSVVAAARAANERVCDVRRGRLPPSEKRPRR